MAVTVVAALHAKPGLGARVIDAFREVSPLVHDEPGCELYAAHLEQEGDTVVMVERSVTVFNQVEDDRTRTGTTRSDRLPV